VIVGHSLGGAVALATAACHPKLPGAIALCDPAILFPEAADEVRRALIEALASPGWNEALREFIELYLFIETDDPARKAWVVREMCANAQHVMHSAFERLASFDADAAARACAVPLLHIDAAVPIADTDRFRRLCPQLETDLTPDAGHFHQLEAPGAINRILQRFVDVDASS
jgi:pimeloyl-ACP methyl ester carboxylesterase